MGCESGPFPPCGSVHVALVGGRRHEQTSGFKEVAMSFNQDIVARAKANSWFREVLSTGPNCQVVVMSIPPGGEIGEEVHDRVDQVLVCVEGEGSAVLEGSGVPSIPGTWSTCRRAPVTTS